MSGQHSAERYSGRNTDPAAESVADFLGGTGSPRARIIGLVAALVVAIAIPLILWLADIDSVSELLHGTGVQGLPTLGGDR
jgi:hypothetical protein